MTAFRAVFNFNIPIALDLPSSWLPFIRKDAAIIGRYGPVELPPDGY